MSAIDLHELTDIKIKEEVVYTIAQMRVYRCKYSENKNCKIEITAKQELLPSERIPFKRYEHFSDGCCCSDVKTEAINDLEIHKLEAIPMDLESSHSLESAVYESSAEQFDSNLINAENLSSSGTVKTPISKEERPLNVESSKTVTSLPVNPAFYCQHCDKHFTTKNYLTRHVATRHSASPPAFACRQCNKVFTLKSNLIKHIKTSHLATPPTYQFLHCDKVLSAKNCLRRHIQVLHASQKPAIPCPQCGKHFTHKDQLTKHVKTYHSINPPAFSCPQCKIVFLHKHNLKRHIKAKHSGLPPTFPCPHCDKFYTKKGILNIHIQYMHSDNLKQM